MHRVIHKERRKARTGFTWQKSNNHKNTVYVDAESYDVIMTVSVVTTKQGETLGCVTQRNATVKHAEVGATLLAGGKKQQRGLNIVTDSQDTARLISAGRVPKQLRSILSRDMEKIYITWTSGHEGLEDNEEAKAAACALTHHTSNGTITRPYIT